MVHLRGLHRGAKVTVRLYYSMLIRGIAENARYQAWQGAAGRHRDLRRRHYDNGKPDARGRLLRSVPIGDSSLLSIRARLDKSCRRLSPSPVLRMMRTNISDKLREIAAAIDRGGSAELTRLTVKKMVWGIEPSVIIRHLYCGSGVQAEDKNHQGSRGSFARGAYSAGRRGCICSQDSVCGSHKIACMSSGIPK